MAKGVLWPNRKYPLSRRCLRASTSLRRRTLIGTSLELFKGFLRSIRTKARPLPRTLWHYTSADALAKILETGQLWATHVTTLNDALEYRYLANLLLEETIKRASTTTD